MTVEDQDAAVGRLVREKKEVQYRKGIVSAEIARFREAVQKALLFGEAANVEKVAEQLEPIRQYFSVDGYVGLLRESHETSNRLREIDGLLKALGVG